MYGCMVWLYGMVCTLLVWAARYALPRRLQSPAPRTAAVAYVYRHSLCFNYVYAYERPTPIPGLKPAFAVPYVRTYNRPGPLVTLDQMGREEFGKGSQHKSTSARDPDLPGPESNIYKK